MTAEIMSNLFFVLAFVCVFSGIVFSIMITSFVSKRGTRINFLLIRITIYKYVNQYRKITMEENGKVGPLFYPLVGSFFLALIFTVAGAILKKIA